MAKPQCGWRHEEQGRRLRDRRTRDVSAACARRAEGPVFGCPAGGGVVGPVVAGVFVLLVGDRGRHGRGDGGDGVDEAVDVGVGGGDGGAGSHGARYAAAVSSSDGVVVGADLFVGEVQEPHEVGVGAEAAVADADAVLGAQPGGDERVVDALDGEGGDGERRRVEARGRGR